MAYTREDIDRILNSNPRAVGRAMIVLFQRQTADEQRRSSTRHQNGRGFNAYSARSGSYYARWVKSGRRLTGRHLAKARSIALRHSRQLVEEANEKLQG